jgi:hypothetical protein
MNRRSRRQLSDDEVSEGGNAPIPHDPERVVDSSGVQVNVKRAGKPPRGRLPLNRNVTFRVDVELERKVKIYRAKSHDPDNGLKSLDEEVRRLLARMTREIV